MSYILLEYIFQRIVSYGAIVKIGFSYMHSMYHHVVLNYVVLKTDHEKLTLRDLQNNMRVRFHRQSRLVKGPV